jgi:hypothetical protein
MNLSTKIPASPQHCKMHFEKSLDVNYSSNYTHDC